MKQAISKKEETLNTLRQQKEVGKMNHPESFVFFFHKGFVIIPDLRYVLCSLLKREPIIWSFFYTSKEKNYFREDCLNLCALPHFVKLLGYESDFYLQNPSFSYIPHSDESKDRKRRLKCRSGAYTIKAI